MSSAIRRAVDAFARKLALRRDAPADGAGEANRLRRELRRARRGRAAMAPAHAAVERFVATGDLTAACLDYVRSASVRLETRGLARGLAHRLYDAPGDKTLGALAVGVFLAKQEFLAPAHACFEEAGAAAARAHCPAEYFDAALAVDPATGCAALTAYLNDAAPPPATVLDLTERLVKHGFYTAARHMLDRLAEAASGLDAAEMARLDGLRASFAAYGAPAPDLPPGTISLAVMDYRRPDAAGGRRDGAADILSLAALGQVARFSGLTFSGDADLARLATALQDHAPPPRRAPDPKAAVWLTPLDRDFASGRRYPPGCWLIANGVFMAAPYGGVADFPFPPEVRPIFIGFGLEDAERLSEPVVDYLKRWSPIGCRDWGTVYHLRARGVPCFFSGCLTATLDLILARRSAAKTSALEGAFASESQAGGILHVLNRLREALAEEWMEAWDLPSFLALKAMGASATFQAEAPSRADREGLTNVDAPSLDAMRSGINFTLEQILTSIFSGESVETVTQRWRDLTMEDVAAAATYCSDFPPAAQSDDSATALAAIERRPPELTRMEQEAIHLAFTLDGNMKAPFAALLQSIAEHTPGPIVAHVLARGFSPAYEDRLSAAFPEIAFDFFRCDRIDYGAFERNFSHITSAAKDRVFLPELLSGTDRVLYLDVDVLALADLRPLYGIELGDAPLAGVPHSRRGWRTVGDLVERAIAGLEPDAAWTLRRRLAAERPLHAPNFNSGVVTMNLKAMRADAFVRRFLPYVRECRFTDQDALNLYAAGRALLLDRAWNFMPNHDHVSEPKLIHWAGPTKPWDDGYVLGQATYEAYAARAAARMEAAGGD